MRPMSNVSPPSPPRGSTGGSSSGSAASNNSSAAAAGVTGDNGNTIEECKRSMTCHFDVTENPLSDYILQYNSCGIVCYSLEDIVSERSENRHFRPPHSHSTPLLQRTSANIRSRAELN